MGKEEKMKAGAVRKLLFGPITLLYFGLIAGLPVAACYAAVVAVPEGVFRLVVLSGCPLIFLTLYTLFAGMLSLPHQRFIVPGRFPRTTADRAYFHRRLYGLCWTSVYYCTPLYFAVLSIPFVKKPTFWLFGYRGGRDLATYPDTWLRDIPLLKFGNGVYLSNRATIGTNIALADGSLLVDSVHIGARSLVGHLTMITPGVQIGRDVDIGVGVAIGLKSMIGDAVKINPCTAIEHGVKIGQGTKVGSMVYIGSGVRLGEGLVIPSGITIPQKTQLLTQSEVAFFAAHVASARNNLHVAKRIGKSIEGIERDRLLKPEIGQTATPLNL